MSWGHHTGTVHDGTGRGHHADGGSPIDANGADGRDHSAHYLSLSSARRWWRSSSPRPPCSNRAVCRIPLVRIGTGAAGLILQTIPFMLVGAMMSAAVSTFVSADALERHVPKSLAGGLAMAMIGGLCLPVCDCMVVPTFANLVRKRLPLPYATALLCAAPVMNPTGDLVHVVRVHGQSMDGGGPRGSGHAGGERRGIVVRRPPVPLPPPVRDLPLTRGPDAGL